MNIRQVLERAAIYTPKLELEIHQAFAEGNIPDPEYYPFAPNCYPISPEHLDELQWIELTVTVHSNCTFTMLPGEL